MASRKWVAFVTAPDQITGEMWCSMLRASGVNCRLRDSNPSFIGPSLYPVRLMAPEEESDLALEILQNEVVLGPKNESRAMRERQERRAKGEVARDDTFRRAQDGGADTSPWPSPES